MDKTKEEIINEYEASGEYPTYYHESDIELMMQAYADQEKRKTAMSFLDWALTENSQFDYVDNDFYWKGDKDGDMPITDEQLYDLYLKSLTQHT